MRKLMEAKMKDVPQEQREQIISMIEKDPNLFKKIAEEIKQKMDAGKDQMSASMEVMQKYETELKNLK